MMAGLWEFWEGADGSEIELCVITTEANETLSAVHHRMPVMLDASHCWEDWLLAGDRQHDKLVSLLRPAPEPDFRAYSISKDVNKVSNDTPALWQKRRRPRPPKSRNWTCF